MFGAKKKKEPQQKQEEKGSPKNQSIPSSMTECEETIKKIFCGSTDMIIENFATRADAALIVYVDGLINKDLVDRDIVRPLKSGSFEGDVSFAIKSVHTKTKDLNKAVEDILSGNVAVFYEGSGEAHIIEVRGWEHRSVEEPAAESVIRGPKEGFNENIRVNTALIRRKVKTPKLIFETMTLGKQTATAVMLAYIDDIVNKDVLERVRQRLSAIDIGAVLETGTLEQLIEENTFSPISGIGLTQKPDIAASRLLEGRVAVLCDGTPHVLTIPELFVENIQTVEDYYNRFIYTNILRILRFLGLFVTVMLPGLYVAVLTYNAQMIPSVFLISTISATQNTPMPIAVEILVMTVMFELLKEAGTRLPKAVGSAITIVGSLIIGEAAVNAGIISEPSVIIVALTAVTSFMVPNLIEFTLTFRALYWFLGSTMGLIGIGAGFIIMMTLIISTDSFGIPILSSLSKEELKDSLIRFPIRSLKFRPQSIVKNNVRRQK